MRLLYHLYLIIKSKRIDLESEYPKLSRYFSVIFKSNSKIKHCLIAMDLEISNVYSIISYFDTYSCISVITSSKSKSTKLSPPLLLL